MTTQSTLRAPATQVPTPETPGYPDHLAEEFIPGTPGPCPSPTGLGLADPLPEREVQYFDYPFLPAFERSEGPAWGWAERC